MLIRTTLISLILLVGTLAANAQEAASSPSPNGAQENVAGDEQNPRFTIEILTVSDNIFRTPKSSYRAGKDVFVELDMTNTFGQDISLGMSDPFTHLRMSLTKNGEKVPFNKETQERLNPQREKSPFHGNAMVTLKAGSRMPMEVINLTDWYGPLAPGSYDLTVWRIWGKGRKSNTISFWIIP